MIDLMRVVAVDSQICVQRRGIASSQERRAARISLGGRVVVCCIATTSSDRSGISASPTVFRDKELHTVLRTPGMCSTRNRYRSDFRFIYLVILQTQETSAKTKSGRCRRGHLEEK